MTVCTQLLPQSARPLCFFLLLRAAMDGYQIVKQIGEGSFGKVHIPFLMRAALCLMAVIRCGVQYGEEMVFKLLSKAFVG
jgi:hypothetical protein